MAGGQGGEAERAEQGVGQGTGEGGALAEPPRAMGAASGFRRQILADAAMAQLRTAGAPALPPRFHCCQAMQRERRLTHWSKPRNTDGVSQIPK
jgi:hypothetical protein